MSGAVQPFSPIEDEHILAHYPEVARLQELLSERSANSIRKRAKLLGVKKVKISDWRMWEDRVLRSCHPDRQMAAVRLPHRTEGAIAERSLALGLATKQWFQWTPDRLGVLRQLVGRVTDREAARILGTNKRSVAKKRRQLGIEALVQPKPSRSDWPVVQDIRAEAMRVGKGLKSLYGKGGGPLASYGRPNPSVVASVVEKLGGELYVEWED